MTANPLYVLDSLAKTIETDTKDTVVNGIGVCLGDESDTSCSNFEKLLNLVVKHDPNSTLKVYINGELTPMTFWNCLAEVENIFWSLINDDLNDDFEDDLRSLLKQNGYTEELMDLDLFNAFKLFSSDLRSCLLYEIAENRPPIVKIKNNKYKVKTQDDVYEVEIKETKVTTVRKI